MSCSSIDWVVIISDFICNDFAWLRASKKTINELDKSTITITTSTKAKPFIKKAKDALRGTADALSPQAVTDTGIPVDIPDTTTNVTQPITKEKPKALEMQVRARYGTQKFEGAIDKFKYLTLNTYAQL